MNVTITARLLKIFWCSTPDHEKDWFVVARDATEARGVFASHESYRLERHDYFIAAVTASTKWA
jgi:hypothetical protein